MFAIYLGMLREEDFVAMRKFFSRFTGGIVTMLYDGHCYYCTRIAFMLRTCDWLGKLRFANMRDADARHAYAPGVTLHELDRVVHAQKANGTLVKSYEAFRIIMSRLPLFWIFVPLWWLPGMNAVCTPVYDYFASRRKRCNDESCKVS
jgi:predicted DCC family thiol-disulfide oxidoreductase YuxK